MSSTFPEKLFFDREKYRTPRINEVILRALNADKGFRKSKSGLTPKNLVLSALVDFADIFSNSFLLDLQNLSALNNLIVKSI